MSDDLTLNRRLGGTRVGLIVPSVNATIEPEFAWCVDAGVSFHAVRVMLTETTPGGLRAMNAGIAAATGLLRSLAPDVVAYACTSGSFLEGREALQRLAADIGQGVGCPVVSTSQAMVEAFRALGLRRIAVLTPYLDSINALERRFIEAEGIEVSAIRGMNLSGAQIREVPPHEIYAAAIDRLADDADALFISCTDFRALETVPALETALGKPVLTSNQVTLWAVLRACGYARPVPRLGAYLSVYPEGAA